VERDHMEDLDLYGRIILRNSLGVWTAFVWLRIWTEREGGSVNMVVNFFDIQRTVHRDIFL